MQPLEDTVGIDLGGTSTRIGLYDQHMQLRGFRTMETPVAAGPKAAVESMAACIRAILSEVGSSAMPPVGIGSPGPINLRGGVLGLLPNLPGWDNFPLRNALSEATGSPVILESDANAAAIAEWKLGAGRNTGLDTMAMVTLGTGVGSGIILNGRVWHGTFGMAGEVGHATVSPDGLPCSCGSQGCLEMYASASGVVRLYLAHLTQSRHRSTDSARAPWSARSIAELAHGGEPEAIFAYTQLGRFLGIGLANLVSTLDPPVIVVGGGVAEAWDLFADSMFKGMRDYSVVYRLMEPSQRSEYEADKTFVTPASLGPSAGLIGAALLPRIAKTRGELRVPYRPSLQNVAQVC